jgi:hypothetical protein
MQGMRFACHILQPYVSTLESAFLSCLATLRQVDDSGASDLVGHLAPIAGRIRTLESMLVQCVQEMAAAAKSAEMESGGESQAEE